MKQPFSPPQPGARIAVVAPSSSPRADRLEAGLHWLTTQGFLPHCTWRSPLPEGYVAGSEATRQAELQAALGDDSVSLIWAARGGYGVLPLLPLLQPVERATPPWVLGFSDVSLLLATLTQRWGWRTWHAPNVTSIPRLDASSLEALRSLLHGRLPSYPTLQTVVPGQATGPLLAMNLSMLMAAAGTSFFPALSGRVLVLEETNEPPYRLDRLFAQLFLQPDFPKLAGLVLGDLGSGGEDAFFVGRLHSRLEALGIPTASHFPMGHGPSNWPVPNGLEARLNTGSGRLECG